MYSRAPLLALALTQTVACGLLKDPLIQEWLTDTNLTTSSPDTTDFTTAATGPMTTTGAGPATGGLETSGGLGTSSGTTQTPTTGPTTSTTVDPTTGPGTTTGLGSCTAPADDADEDDDGVINKVDNCRCDPNPNQLDFNENSLGNVCDEPLRFGVVVGAPPEFNKLDTTATVEMFLSCEFPVSLIVVGGDLQIDLDDNGNGKIFAASLNYADTPEVICSLGIFSLKLKIEQFVTTGDMPFVVGFPFQVADHMAGAVTGMMDMAHTIIINGVINVTESSNPDLVMPGPLPLMEVPGAFPAGVVTVTKATNEAQIVFDNGSVLVFEQMTMPGLLITLTGLKGTLKMKI